MTTIKKRSLSVALSAVSTQADEATVLQEGGAWIIRARSTDSVSLVEAKIGPEAFSDVTFQEAFSMDLSDLMVAAKGDGEVRMELKDGMMSMSADIGGATKRYRRRVIDRSTVPDVKIPQLNMDAEAMAPVGTVLEAFTAAKGSNEAVEVKVSSEGLSIAVMGDGDMASDELDVPAGSCTMIDGEARSLYPLDRTRDMLKALPKDADVSMALSTDYPMRMSCTAEGCELTMLVAPRIES